MDLLSFRLPGHPVFADLGWISVGRGLTLFSIRHSLPALNLLLHLQAISPPYRLDAVRPLDAPLALAREQNAGFALTPSKKTAVLAIYAASRVLVRQLAQLDSLFYETDRIEFGLRFDYHQWISFVEMAASFRWSELEPSLDQLLGQLGQGSEERVAALRGIMGALSGAERVKGELATALRAEVSALESLVPESQQLMLREILAAINRPGLFRQAKEIAAKHLPLFFVLSADAGEQASPAVSARLFVQDRTVLPFLAGELKRMIPDAGRREEELKRLNTGHRIAYPGSGLEWRLEDEALLLQGKGNFAGTAATLCQERISLIEPLASALAALHSLLYQCPPIILLNLHGLVREPGQHPELLSALGRIATDTQLIATAEEDFFAYCRNALEHEQGQTDIPAALLDLRSLG